MDECLETCWRLVYYQVSGEPGIACCSRRSDIYLRDMDLHASYIIVILFFACLIFVVGLDRDIILKAKFSTVTADCTTKKLLSCYQTLFLMRGWGLGADWCRLSRTLANIHAKYENSNIAVFTPTCIPAQSRTSETACHKLDLRTLEKTETQCTFVNYSILKNAHYQA